MAASGNTVTVGCRLPNGALLHLIDQSGERQEVRLRGVAQRPNIEKPWIVGGETRTTKAAESENTYVQGGAALTHGVDADFMAKWAVAYKDWPPFKSGHIFVASGEKAAESMAKERRELTTGMEPINADAPPGRVVKRADEDA